MSLSKRTYHTASDEPLTPSHFADVLRHDSGVLYWTKKVGPKIQPQSRAGCLGYRNAVVVRFHGHLFNAAEIVWTLEHNAFPEGKVIHLNDDRKDNTPSNLHELPRV